MQEPEPQLLQNIGASTLWTTVENRGVIWKSVARIWWSSGPRLTNGGASTTIAGRNNETTAVGMGAFAWLTSLTGKRSVFVQGRPLDLTKK